MVTKIGTINNEDLIGSALADVLDGSKAGRHRLYGLAGDDRLYGGNENDILDGGTGVDVMSGGQGDDLYRVDNINDQVIENDNGGIDTIESSISYSLNAYVEKLSLTGSAAIDGFGNELSNRIKGNDSANTLSAGAGADTVSGGGGDDWIIGGAGKDTIDGGSGADTYQLAKATGLDSDRILDFSRTDDKLAIVNTDFGLRLGRGYDADLSLDPTYFQVVSGFSPQGTAVGHGQFLYNTSSLTLSWDPDGAGSAFLGIPIATFASDVQLQSNMFKILESGLPNRDAIAPATNQVSAHVNVASAIISINATDPDSDPLTYTVAQGSEPLHGSVSFDQQGSFVYTPFNGYQGADAFAISISDGFGSTIEQRVTVDVSDVPPFQDSNPTVINITDTRMGFAENIGAVDPAGVAWAPAFGDRPGMLFISDSEVDEAPYNSPNNLFALNLDGSPAGDTFKFNLGSFTKEPTGLAYNPLNGFLYISDDDLYKIFWVDPSNPSVKLGEFSTKQIGGTDPEDIAINPLNGNIFISNGTPSHFITEVTSDGRPVSQTRVPDIVEDMEALAYDSTHDVFLVGGGFSSTIWAINRAGSIVETIDLSPYRNPSDTKLAVKDIAIAPSSSPTDDPSNMNLYVTDYGRTHSAGDNDGRLLEINLGWSLIA